MLVKIVTLAVRCLMMYYFFFPTFNAILEVVGFMRCLSQVYYVCLAYYWFVLHVYISIIRCAYRIVLVMINLSCMLYMIVSVVSEFSSLVCLKSLAEVQFGASFADWLERKMSYNGKDNMLQAIVLMWQLWHCQNIK